MEEFNSDNEKIEAALKERNCQFYTTSYTHATAQMKQDAADAIGGVISQQMR